MRMSISISIRIRMRINISIKTENERKRMREYGEESRWAVVRVNVTRNGSSSGDSGKL